MIIQAWGVIVVFLWGVFIAISSSAFGATPLEPFGTLFPSEIISSIFFICAFLGSLGIYKKNSLLLLPVLVILVVASSSSMTAILNSAYGDGVIRPREFIASDQLIIVVASVGFLFSIVSKRK